MLEQAKAFLRIDGSALDDQVSGWIAAARVQVEAMTGTRLVDQVVMVFADSFEDLDHLPIGEVTEIVEIRYLDQAGADQVLDAASYERFGAGLEQGIRPAISALWPQIRSVQGAVRVTLAVGYGAAGAVPKNIWLALLQTIRGIQDDEPADVDWLLVNHRIWL